MSNSFKAKISILGSNMGKNLLSVSQLFTKKYMENLGSNFYFLNKDNNKITFWEISEDPSNNLKIDMYLNGSISLIYFYDKTSDVMHIKKQINRSKQVRGLIKIIAIGVYREDPEELQENMLDLRAIIDHPNIVYKNIAVDDTNAFMNIIDEMIYDIKFMLHIE